MTAIGLSPIFWLKAGTSQYFPEVDQAASQIMALESKSEWNEGLATEQLVAFAGHSQLLVLSFPIWKMGLTTATPW